MRAPATVWIQWEMEIYMFPLSGPNADAGKKGTYNFESEE